MFLALFGSFTLEKIYLFMIIYKGSQIEVTMENVPEKVLPFLM